MVSRRKVAAARRHRGRLRGRIGPTLAACTVLVFARATCASPAVGTLANFDVVNDTGEPTHGFEIEIEGLHPEDVTYTFGGTYSRYGDPEIASVPAGTSTVVVRYRRWSGSAWASTPVAQAIQPHGHDCFAGGPVGNYEQSDCERFGVSLRANPSRVTYRWLVAAEPVNQNTSFAPSPVTVALPVPVWDVQPPAVGPAPGNVAAAAVRAELEPLEEEHEGQYGEPQWLRVFKVESEEKLEPADLVRLLLGARDSIVPGETEVETEWKLNQSKPGNAEGDQEDADIREGASPRGRRAVVRRYEFYRYTGPRDPENNEAMPCVADDTPTAAEAPVNGCSDLGEFVGAQNVAVDVGLSAAD
ncbi:MAG: hypothetical protein N3C12_01725 [Candidatus Binatia bacterium]|nr:hypothetical protein [Candidatus Binatia bacterium]